MKSLDEILHEFALVAFIVVCAGWSIVAWQISQAVQPLQASIVGLSESGQTTLRAVDAEIPQLQASVQSTAASVNSTSTAVSGVAHQVGNQIPTISTKLNSDLDETHRLILESGLTAMEARKASSEERAALPAITAKTTRSLDDLHDELAELQTTTRDLDTLISDPANARTLKHLDDGTAALAATAKDGQQFTHGLLHPSWPHRVWGVVLDVAHVFNPL